MIQDSYNNYKGRWIGNHINIWLMKWHQDQWPWVTLKVWNCCKSNTLENTVFIIEDLFSVYPQTGQCSWPIISNTVWKQKTFLKSVAVTYIVKVVIHVSLETVQKSFQCNLSHSCVADDRISTGTGSTSLCSPSAIAELLIYFSMFPDTECPLICC